MIKFWLFILFIILTIYTPTELTDVIIKHVSTYGYQVKFFGEVCFIWITYACAIGVLLCVLRRAKV